MVSQNNIWRGITYSKNWVFVYYFTGMWSATRKQSNGRTPAVM